MWNQSKIEIEFTLVRHGATPANEEHRYLGSTEESLSDRGIAQMRKCKEALKDYAPDILLVSPMKRCKESANILFPEMKQQEIGAWKEMDFGSYECKNYLELKDDPYYQTWIESNGTLPFPEGECQEAFMHRCAEGLQQVLRMLEESRKNENLLRVAAVVHGGTIMAVMSTLTGGNYFDYQVANGCGYRFRLGDKNLEEIKC